MSGASITNWLAVVALGALAVLGSGACGDSGLAETKTELRAAQTELAALQTQVVAPTRTLTPTPDHVLAWKRQATAVLAQHDLLLSEIVDAFGAYVDILGAKCAGKTRDCGQAPLLDRLEDAVANYRVFAVFELSTLVGAAPDDVSRRFAQQLRDGIVAFASDESQWIDSERRFAASGARSDTSPGELPFVPRTALRGYVCGDERVAALCEK